MSFCRFTTMKLSWLWMSFVLVYVKSQDSEPFSDVDIFHTWNSGLEGYFYVNPPDEIHSWVVHITLDKPMDIVEVSFFPYVYALYTFG